MINMPEETTIISAPGKVLLAGGYLVVDRTNQGLVLGLSARIHVIVSSNLQSSVVNVRSPQFEGAAWEYQCKGQSGNGVKVDQVSSSSGSTSPPNKFVQTALEYVLSYLSSHGIYDIPGLSVTILADSDYYSHSETSKDCSKNPESRFKDFGVKLQDAHKTGLGSSAALVTAFSSAVILHCLRIKTTQLNDDLRRKLHNLAQIAHCVAQGKIGSGFDVAAAVFGACIYRRFSPSILEQVGTAGTEGFEAQLAEVVDDTGKSIWDTEINAMAVDIPKTLRLVMCDVDCGSETPSMVRKVMQWRKEQPEESLSLWENLSAANMQLAAELERLCKSSDSDSTCLTKCINAVRSLIRKMSVEAEVPIEPPVQTHLLDSCSALQGVIGGVVPGAGGYDALSIIIEDRPDVMAGLESFLKTYESPQHLAMDTKIGKVRLLDVKQEADGLKVESDEQYAGWI